jgi:hypothetical protein
LEDSAKMKTSGFLKARIERALAGKGYLLWRIDELTCLADLFGSDKGTRYSAHLYTRIYANLFRPLRHDRLTIVEIGLHRSDLDKRHVGRASNGSGAAVGTKAPSLEVWRQYFPYANVFGFDIDDFSGVKIDNCKIVRGDMSSRDDLAQLIRAIGRPIDIIIEDGSHASHHQQIALGYLFRHIRPGGMYIIEDLHWQDETIEPSDGLKTKDILRRCQIDGSISSSFFMPEEQEYIQKNVKKVMLYDSFSTEVEDPTDALGVIVKK